MKPDLGNVIINDKKPGEEEAALNEKFWDLNKTKQNSMINGALKVFSRDGFRHASTDEIVAEAGISKGLLFHYFYSKSGIYEFLAEYSARFALVELNSGIAKAGPLPYFELQRKITASECSAMRRYPYMFLFLERAESDGTFENQEAVLSGTAPYNERRSEVLAEAVLPGTLQGILHAVCGELSLDGFLASAGTVSQRIPALYHESGDDPVNGQAGIEALIRPL